MKSLDNANRPIRTSVLLKRQHVAVLAWIQRRYQLSTPSGALRFAIELAEQRMKESDACRARKHG